MHGRMFVRLAGILTVVALGTAPGTAWPQDYAQTPYFDAAYEAAGEPGLTPANHLRSTNAAYAELEARLSALEAKLGDDEPLPEWEDVSDEKFTVKVSGRVHGDYVMFADQDTASRNTYGDQQNYFEFRRIYLAVQGEGYGVYDYKVELDFEPEGVVEDASGVLLATTDATSVRDVYVGIHHVPLLGYVRFGNFKEPFSLEEVTSNRYLTFMERAFPVDMWAPARHVGVAAFNHSEAGDFTWSAGAFFEDVIQTIKQQIDDRQGIDVALRGTWNPYYQAEGRGLVHLGAGYVFTDDRNDLLVFRSRPEVHEGDVFIGTGILNVDYYHRGNLEMALVYGPFSVQSELFAVRTNGIRGTLDNDFYGAYVYASYFLTGEHRPYDRDMAVFSRTKPNTNFWIVRTPGGPCLGWGAWELATRWSWADLSDAGIRNDVAGQLHNLTVGVNWYWNAHTRMMFNWIHAFSDVQASAENTNTDILGISMRFDF